MEFVLTYKSTLMRDWQLLTKDSFYTSSTVKTVPLPLQSKGKAEMSIKAGGAPQMIPDFTKGAYKTRPRFDVTD